VILLRLLPAIFLGAFLGGLLGSFFTAGDWLYTLVWALAIPAFILVSLVVGLGRGRGLGSPGLALARIESVQRAGAEAGGVQDLDLRVVVAPVRGRAYTTTTRQRVSTDALRDYNAGTVHVVSRLGANRPEVSLITAPDAQWMSLAEEARRDPSRIPSSSNAAPWETATTTTPGTAAPSGARGRGGLVISLLATGATIAVVLVPAYGSIGRAFTNLANWDLDGGNMITGRYQQLAVDELAAVAGGYDFTDINFYPDYVLADGPTAPGADTTDTYQWRYGRAMREGPEFIQPSDLRAELFDASELDFSVIGAVADDAIGRSRLQDVEEIYLFVRRDPVDAAHEPVIHVSVNGPYEDAAFTYGFDGALIRTG
jgi:hypothetical protein